LAIGKNHRGAPSLPSAALTGLSCQNNGLFVNAHCRHSQPFCQAKKFQVALERIKSPRFIDLSRIPVQK
jgi:hypothetical protein